MAVSALDSGTSATAAPKSGFSAMTSEDFTKLIFTELSKQDPTQPSDTNQLLQQLSQIRSIQSNTDLSTRLSTLVNQNEFSNASTLIGKTVSGVSEDNERVAGTVGSISRTQNGVYLTLLTGQRVRMSNVDQIQDPAPRAPTNNAATNTGSNTGNNVPVNAASLQGLSGAVLQGGGGEG